MAAKDMSMLVAPLLIGLVIAATAGCETSNSVRTENASAENASAENASAENASAEHASTNKPGQAGHALAPEVVDGLVDQVEHLRDRSFETPPRVDQVAAADQLPDPERPPGPVRDQRALLMARLFGMDDVSAAQPDRVDPLTALARYDADGQRVVYVKVDDNLGAVKAAVVAALTRALDAQYAPPMAAPTSWDAYLAQRAARQATISLTMARYLLAKAHPDASLDTVAERPELAANIPHFSAWLLPSANDLKNPHPADSPDRPGPRLDARQRALVLRHGWTLGAALYRSNGWSGAELARAMPPTRSADVARPDQWMAGEPVGTWTWPGDPDETDPPTSGGPAGQTSGTVGPTVMATWLEDVVSAGAAQSIFAGYVSDAFRDFQPPSDDAQPSFEWLTLWETPSDAAQVTRAFEKRLRRSYPGRDQADCPCFSVFHQGLVVGVVIDQRSTDDRRARAKRLLADHRVQLNPRRGLPTHFVPTRQDRLVAQTNEATLEERIWRDPATNLRMDLNSLGDTWRVQQPDRGEVRWFARRDDEALLQLTSELADPLGPAFGSEQYRHHLVDAFKTSIAQATVTDIGMSDTSSSGRLHLRLAGKIDGAAKAVEIWQFERDDILITYSLQGAPGAVDEVSQTALALLNNARPLADDSDQSGTDRPDDDNSDQAAGIIRYQVDESAP